MYIILSLLSLGISAFGAWFILFYGLRFGLMDLPSNRSSHAAPTPKGGGIGILIAFFVCSLALGMPWWFFSPAVILSLISFVGDRRDIPPRWRLVIQFICSMVFLTGLFVSRQVGCALSGLIIPLCIFVVGTCNFYNFMDGINGIAGITGVVGFLLLSVYGAITGGDSVYIISCLAVAFSCAGFLPLNIPKAKVFMGDVGSILLGFVFSCMGVILSRSLLDFICLAGFLFLFYADELTTMFVRIKAGESLSKPHRRHLYQILANECGIDHWKISAGYGVIQLVIGVVLIAFRTEWNLVLIFLILCFLAFSVVSLSLRHATRGHVTQTGVK